MYNRWGLILTVFANTSTKIIIGGGVGRYNLLSVSPSLRQNLFFHLEDVLFRFNVSRLHLLQARTRLFPLFSRRVGILWVRVTESVSHVTIVQGTVQLTDYLWLKTSTLHPRVIHVKSAVIGPSKGTLSGLLVLFRGEGWGNAHARHSCPPESTVSTSGGLVSHALSHARSFVASSNQFWNKEERKVLVSAGDANHLTILTNHELTCDQAYFSLDRAEKVAG